MAGEEVARLGEHGLARDECRMEARELGARPGMMGVTAVEERHEGASVDEGGG
jgi:hypothetical protein